jgi:hypothetical protein
MRFIYLVLLTLLLIPLNYYVADPEREMQLSVGEENGIYYLVFNPRAYDYVYRNCYVCIERGHGRSCVYDLGGDGYKIYKRLGIVETDTNTSEYRIYVSEKSNKSYLEPIPDEIAEYLSKLNLKIDHITSFRNALIIYAFKDSSIKLPKNLISKLEELPPRAELRRKIAVVVIQPVTEEQGKKAFDIMNKIGREATNGSLRSFCVVTSMLQLVPELVGAYVDGRCLEEKGISERQAIDAIRNVVDESYPLMVIIDYNSTFSKISPLPLERRNNSTPTTSSNHNEIYVIPALLSLVAIAMLARRRKAI